MDARDRREDAVEKWLPPVKKLAIQSPNGIILPRVYRAA